jgi:hypothetical protein
MSRLSGPEVVQYLSPPIKTRLAFMDMPPDPKMAGKDRCVELDPFCACS